MKKNYGNTQVREIRFSKADIQKLALENLKERGNTPYDFDYSRPIVIWDDLGNLVFRFVQKQITTDSRTDMVRFKSFEELKNK